MPTTAPPRLPSRAPPYPPQARFRRARPALVASWRRCCAVSSPGPSTPATTQVGAGTPRSANTTATRCGCCHGCPARAPNLHDHGDARGAYGVVSGRLTELTVEGRGARARTERLAWTPAAVRLFGPGLVHQVSNTSDSRAVSLHVHLAASAPPARPPPAGPGPSGGACWSARRCRGVEPTSMMWASASSPAWASRVANALPSSSRGSLPVEAMKEESMPSGQTVLAQGEFSDEM